MFNRSRLTARSRVFTLLAASTGLVASLLACASDDDSGSGSSEASFCDALASAYSKCGGASASCSTPLAADCTKLVGLLSGSALAAATKCLNDASCDVDPLACVGKSISEATTSDAQTKLANDYCESCAAVGGEACKTAFFGTASTPGLAIALVPFGDPAIEAVDSACTSNKLGKTACQAAFSSCLTATITKFVATSISADSATCLIDGIKNGLSNVGPTDGPPDSGSGPCTGSDCEPACGPENCAGCCDATGKCSTAATERACGTGGGACAECDTGKVCEGGACIDATCKSSCASGCCNAQGCQSGNTNAACGTGGAACAVCGTSQTCSGSKCEVATTATFDFVAVGASLPSTKLDGSSWDAFSGLPDPKAKAASGSTVGETTYKSDTLKPVWNTTVLSNLTAATLKGNLAIELTDSDTAFDDAIGGCTLTLKDADFDGMIHTASCPKSATSVAFTFDYKLKTH